MSSQLPNDILEPDRRRTVYANSMLELVSTPLPGLELEPPIPEDDPSPDLGVRHASMRRGFRKQASARSPYYTQGSPYVIPEPEPQAASVVIGRVNESAARGVFPAIREWALRRRGKLR